MSGISPEALRRLEDTVAAQERTVRPPLRRLVLGFVLAALWLAAVAAVLWVALR